MRTVRLYGELGKKYGKVHNVEVDSVSEAIRALCVNFSEFKQELIDSESRMVAYEVWDGQHNIDPDTHSDFVKKGVCDIKIIPRIIGAGNAAKIIVGIVLVAVSWWMGGAAGWAYLGSAGYGMATAVFYMGTSLIMSGVVGMMTPTASGTSIDSQGSSEDKTQSYIFSGAQNTTRQGAPVFVAYGTHLLGSQVISVALKTVDVPVSTGPALDPPPVCTPPPFLDKWE